MPLTKFYRIKINVLKKATKLFSLLFLFVATANLSAEIQNSKCENQIFFITPMDGLISDKQEIYFEFGTNNISINPAGKIPQENTDPCFVSGHHHLIINDVYEPSLEGSIPFKENVHHFGGGQTSAVISLDPGKYSLQLVLGDYMHMPINLRPLENNFIVSKKIFIEVLD